MPMLDEKTLQDIHDRVVKDVDKVWNSQWAPITLTHCTKCDPLAKGVKRRCITSIMSYDALCPDCWARQREAEIIKEVEDMRKPKLDVVDFAKI